MAFLCKSTVRPILSVVRRATTQHGKSTNKTVETAIEEMQGSWKRNLELKRPLSPYKYYLFDITRLTSTTSITHRITGAAMGVVIPAFGVAYLSFRPHFDNVINAMGQWPVGPVVKFMVAFPLTYHYINGMRHLSWDWAKGFAMPTITKTGIGAMSAGIAIAGSLALLKLDRDAVRERIQHQKSSGHSHH